MPFLSISLLIRSFLLVIDLLLCSFCKPVLDGCWMPSILFDFSDGLIGANGLYIMLICRLCCGSSPGLCDLSAKANILLTTRLLQWVSFLIPISFWPNQILPFLVNFKLQRYFWKLSFNNFKTRSWLLN